MRDHGDFFKWAKRDMPDFEDQDRPKKVIEIYKAIKRDNPETPPGDKAQFAHAAYNKMRKQAAQPSLGSDRKKRLPRTLSPSSPIRGPKGEKGGQTPKSKNYDIQSGLRGKRQAERTNPIMKKRMLDAAGRDTALGSILPGLNSKASKGSSYIRTKQAQGSESLEGGLADDKPSSRYDQRQLEMGIAVELEHTNNREMAEEIARDHLEENPDYYHDLLEMEAEEQREKDTAEEQYKKMDKKGFDSAALEGAVIGSLAFPFLAPHAERFVAKYPKTSLGLTGTMGALTLASLLRPQRPRDDRYSNLKVAARSRKTKKTITEIIHSYLGDSISSLGDIFRSSDKPRPKKKKKKDSDKKSEKQKKYKQKKYKQKKSYSTNDKTAMSFADLNELIQERKRLDAHGSHKTDNRADLKAEKMDSEKVAFRRAGDFFKLALDAEELAAVQSHPLYYLGALGAMGVDLSTMKPAATVGMRMAGPAGAALGLKVLPWVPEAIRQAAMSVAGEDVDNPLLRGALEGPTRFYDQVIMEPLRAGWGATKSVLGMGDDDIPGK